MSTPALNIKHLFPFLLIVPMALLTGWFLSDPGSPMTVLIAGVMGVSLSLPLLLRWHHALVICLINAPLNAFFLPGQPDLWIVVAGASLLISGVAGGLGDRQERCWTRATILPLLLLLFVVALTIVNTGGIGGRALGSGGWGGKRYVLVMGAVMVFFAISARPIPVLSASKFVAGYFLSGVLAIISNLIFFAGPAFYFLYSIFSVELATFQLREAEIERYTGLTWAALALMYWLLARYGIRGIASRGERLFLFIALLSAGLLGGFRSTLITLGLVLFFQFGFERLYRGRYLVVLTGAVALLMVGLIMGGNRLPLPVQRSISFLPIQLDPLAMQDAASTLEWRVEMWKIVIQEIPQYFWQGKGYTFSGVDFNLTKMAVQQGRYAAYEDTLISGNYHQGLLTIIIPFGIFGLIAFVWFVAAGWLVLYRNYRNGRPELQVVNTFLLSYYSARVLFYCTLYGQFDLEFVVFTSCVAFSLSLNRRRAVAQVDECVGTPTQMPPARIA